MLHVAPAGSMLPPSSPRPTDPILRAASLVSNVTLSAWLGNRVASNQVNEDAVDSGSSEPETKPLNTLPSDESVHKGFCFGSGHKSVSTPSPSMQVDQLNTSQREEPAAGIVPNASLSAALLENAGKLLGNYPLGAASAGQLQMLFALANMNPVACSLLLSSHAQTITNQFWSLQSHLSASYLNDVLRAAAIIPALQNKSATEPVLLVINEIVKVLPLLKLSPKSTEAHSMNVDQQLLDQLKRLSEYLPRLMTKFRTALSEYMSKHSATNSACMDVVSCQEPPAQSATEAQLRIRPSPGEVKISVSKKLPTIPKKDVQDANSDDSLDTLLTAYLKVAGAVKAIDLLKKFDKHFPGPSQRTLVRSIIQQRCRLQIIDGQKYLVLKKEFQ